MAGSFSRGSRLDPLRDPPHASKSGNGTLGNGFGSLTNVADAASGAKRGATLPPLRGEAKRQRSKVTLTSFTAVPAGALPLYEGVIEEDFHTDIRTGNDVIEYYARYGHGARVKVFHCNRALPPGQGSPYELTIVPRQCVDLEYYTITAAGVVHHPDGPGEPEYTPIGEWLREQSIYNLMRQMRFFKYYIHQRFFSQASGGGGRLIKRARVRWGSVHDWPALAPVSRSGATSPIACASTRCASASWTGPSWPSRPCATPSSASAPSSPNSGPPAPSGERAVAARLSSLSYLFVYVGQAGMGGWRMPNRTCQPGSAFSN